MMQERTGSPKLKSVILGGGCHLAYPATRAASLAVMNGTPLLVVAKNLGHSDTRMVEKHYGHLAPSFITEAIRAGAPRYHVKDDKRVVPLR